MEQRIYWNDDEKRALSNEVARLINSGETSKLAAIEKAQKVLPKNRRRTIGATTAIPWIKPALSGKTIPVNGEPPKEGPKTAPQVAPKAGPKEGPKTAPRKAAEAPRSPQTNGQHYTPRNELAVALGAFLAEVLREARKGLQ